jgi:glycosyltransferase involved in cell wall biosynthesis
MMPHVLFCDSLPFWGGGEHWIVTVAKRLSERGWQATVAGREGGELIRRAREVGLDTVAWPYRRDFDPATFAAAGRFLRAKTPDVVLVTTGRDIRTVGCAARLRGLPVVWRMGPLPKHSWLHRITGQWVVDHVIAPSQYVGGKLARFPWLRGKVTVINNGIETRAEPSAAKIAAARAELGVGEAERLVLYLGRLLHAKGVDILLRAYSAVNNCHPDAKLLLVGTGPERETLRRMVRELKLEEKVVFMGFTDDPSTVLSACDVLVLPSRSETFGFVLLEAMMFRKPIVASRVGGIPEVTGDDAAILVDPGEPTALGTALSDLLGDPIKRESLGNAGLKRVRELFLESRMLCDVEAVFSKLTNRSATSASGRERRRAKPTIH